jgi:hypothetical protein
MGEEQRLRALGPNNYPTTAAPAAAAPSHHSIAELGHRKHRIQRQKRDGAVSPATGGVSSARKPMCTIDELHLCARGGECAGDFRVDRLKEGCSAAAAAAADISFGRNSLNQRRNSRGGLQSGITFLHQRRTTARVAWSSSCNSGSGGEEAGVRAGGAGAAVAASNAAATRLHTAATHLPQI